MTAKARRSRHPSELKAWAGFDARGAIAWGTLRPSREACAAEIERINPAVEGYPPPLRIMPVYVGLDLNTQGDMLDQP